eukprot:scaffold419942_cov19-Prasinocladus_malaysianus.AAC.1
MESCSSLNKQAMLRFVCTVTYAYADERIVSRVYFVWVWLHVFGRRFAITLLNSHEHLNACPKPPTLCDCGKRSY